MLYVVASNAGLLLLFTIQDTHFTIHNSLRTSHADYESGWFCGSYDKR